MRGPGIGGWNGYVPKVARRMVVPGPSDASW